MIIAQNDEFNNLTELNSGIFLNKEMVQEIKKQYPGLSDILNNALHLEPGYHVNKPYMKDFMNKVEQREAKIEKQSDKIKALEDSLNSERKQHDLETQKLNNRIDIIKLQRDYWKDRAKNNLHISFKEKAGYAGGGFAAASLLAMVIAIQ